MMGNHCFLLAKHEKMLETLGFDWQNMGNLMIFWGKHVEETTFFTGDSMGFTSKEMYLTGNT
jgi:hypothetical protein